MNNVFNYVNATRYMLDPVYCKISRIGLFCEHFDLI